MSPITAPSPAGEVIVATEAALPAPAADLLTGTAPRRRRWWVPLVSYLGTVFVLLTFNFALPRLMPGDPIDALMAFGNPNYVQNDETRGKLAEYYHLDGSIPEQYVGYLQGLASGDLGTSIVSNRPVAPELLDRVGWSLLLIVTATVISILIGIPTGIHSGWKRGKRVDRGLLAFFLSWQNMPVFILGSVAFLFFAAQLGLFPLGGGITPFSEYSGLAQVVDIARHLALPALIMGIDMATLEYLVMRSSMVTELGSDYLLAGRAKGLRQRRLKYRYAGRNALLPVVTVVGLQASVAVTTVVFIERIFNYPGVGEYMFFSIGTRDYPALQASFLLLTITVVTVNLGVDLLYRRIDPRTTTA